MKFTEKLNTAIKATGSCLCVGLDPNLDLIPAPVVERFDNKPETVSFFLKSVIDATAEHCAAFKPNLGFFEALGADGWDVLEEVLDYIPKEKIIIADAKRGDISSTSEHYAKAFFETLDVDAVTLNPLMGFETLTPFLNYENKGIFVLTLTSNPGSADILTKPVAEFNTMAAYIAGRLREKQETSTTDIGMVVGATKTDEIKPVIQQYRKATLLIPGIGKQGGSVAELRDTLHEHMGLPLVNSSRSVIYAGKDSPDWLEAVSQKAKEFKLKLSSLVEQDV